MFQWNYRSAASKGLILSVREPNSLPSAVLSPQMSVTEILPASCSDCQHSEHSAVPTRSHLFGPGTQQGAQPQHLQPVRVCCLSASRPWCGQAAHLTSRDSLVAVGQSWGRATLCSLTLRLNLALTMTHRLHEAVCIFPSVSLFPLSNLIFLVR